MVRAVQASARHQVRSPRPAHEALQHDQGRIYDCQKEGESVAGLRLEGQGTALCQGRSPRSSQRIPQTQWAARQVAKAGEAQSEALDCARSEPNAPSLDPRNQAWRFGDVEHNTRLHHSLKSNLP